MPGLHPCNALGCPTLTRARHCQMHGANRTSADARQLYASEAWRRVRAQVLSEEPVCRQCMDDGRVVPTTDCDHILKLSIVGLARALDRSNLQGLCHECHARKTARGE
jgi:5-methylcytosine-specific restriction protein A